MLLDKNKSIDSLVEFLAPQGTPERYQNELLSRIFLGIALAVILFIIFNWLFFSFRGLLLKHQSISMIICKQTRVELISLALRLFSFLFALSMDL